jgi:hypothetical protein
MILLALLGAPVLPLLIGARRGGERTAALAAQDAGSPSGSPSPSAPAAPATGTLADDPRETGRVRALVEALADPSFAVRERSTQELLAVGESALPELRRGLESQDPELRRRAQSVIDEIARRSEQADGEARGGLGRRLRDLPELADPAFDEAVRRLDEVFERFDRSFVPVDPRFPDSLFEHPEVADLERRLAEMRDRLHRRLLSFPDFDPFAPGEGNTPEVDGFGSGNSRIQIWRDGEKVFDSSRDTSFAEAPLLGVVVESLHPSLRAHLPIPEGQGVLVADVAPGSRAEAAGLRVHDILLTAGGTPIEDAVSLRNLLRDAAGRKLEIGFIRSGTPSRLEVDLADAAK